jgi:acetoin:2,6-dichlorophenolindophenol oxidoreductase subunit beta
MATTVAETIRDLTRDHLRSGRGVAFGQCVTAVGWIGGTVPELSEDEGIIELSMADVAGAGIAVGAALVNGCRPIYIIRYQGFMWYNAAPLLNYAAKSKEMWGVPCPLLVRAIAMEGGIGPVASGCHHSMVMRMPGMPVVAPMTPGEWTAAWNWYLEHDDPVYISEHRKSFPLSAEMPDRVSDDARFSVFAISASRLTAMEAIEQLEREGLRCDFFNMVWLKPLCVTDEMVASLRRTGGGLVIDSDYSLCGASQSIAYSLTHASGVLVHAMGLEDRTSGFSPHLDNPTPTAERIVRAIRELAPVGV